MSSYAGWIPELYNGSSTYSHYLLAFHSVNPKLSTVGDGVAYGRSDAELLFSIVSEFACTYYIPPLHSSQYSCTLEHCSHTSTPRVMMSVCSLCMECLVNDCDLPYVLDDDDDGFRGTRF